LITPLAYLGFHDIVDKAPYDHINAAEAIREFVAELPGQEADYLDAVRAYSDTLYGRMLQKSGRRYFMDKTPAYALVLPFLTKLYPTAHYVVLTRHPLAVMSSYANSFFDGDWQAAHAFNPVVLRYVPAIARLLEKRLVDSTTPHVHQVGYEQLVQNAAPELSRMFEFLGLPDDPGAVNYGERFEAKAGMGDPITVGQHSAPVATSVEKWVDELAQDDAKLKLAQEIVARLDEHDVRLWGFEKDRLLEPVELAREREHKPFKKTKMNSYVFQRKVMLALKKDIDQRPHGKLIKRVRYYCNVLLRETE
jgi:hypothetical protein